MKTREEIIADIRKWYGMGGEDVNIQEDHITKSVMLTCNIWTAYCQQAIAGPNHYTVYITDKGMYPQRHHVLLVTIYYEE